MPNVDDIINRLLADRRIREGAAFSSRSYTDQPIIERGSDLKARMERRRAERAERHQVEAAERQQRRRNAQSQVDSNPAPTTNQQAALWPQTQTTHEAPAHPRASSAPDLRSFRQMREISRRINAALEYTTASLQPLPKPIRTMREMQQNRAPAQLAYGSGASAWLFYEQANFMADYVDDFNYEVQQDYLHVTYALMTDLELRAYFTWRTKVRAGQVDPCPYSFAHVYVNELLCDVGTTPGIKALSDIQNFGIAYRDADSFYGNKLIGYLGRWMRDYAVYHNLPNVLPKRADELREAVLTLFAAEYDALERSSREPRVKSPWTALVDTPSPDELFEALGNASTYRASGSRLMRDEAELFRDVTVDTFRELVLHCSKRRKTDYVEGLFGYAIREPYMMFSGALFYDPTPHPDTTVLISKVEGYRCQDGYWSHIQATVATKTSKELGLMLHAVDYEIREAIDYPYPLKQRKVPAYLEKIVKKALAARLKEREEAERRQITIDRSKLSTIRTAAALTRDALLTDEDRGEEVFEPTMEPLEFLFNLTADTEPVTEVIEQVDTETTAEPVQQQATLTSQPNETQASETENESLVQDGLLSPLEHRFIVGLMEGRPAGELLLPTDPFVSVVADSINEKLFDLIGDAVIDFDGDEPLLVEDYLEDIKEVLSQ